MTDISVVSLSNPTSSDTLNSGTAALKHATQHANANDQIERIETYMWAAGVPAARVYQSSGQSISTATETVLLFNSESFDTDTMHSTSSNTGRLTATTAGKYLIIANVSYPINATGYREISIRSNGVTYFFTAKMPANSGASSAYGISTTWQMSAGDYVEMTTFQSSGGSLTTNSGEGATTFMMVRIG